MPDVDVAVRGPDGFSTGAADAPARPVFSVTKMFVATAAVQLVEMRRLTLDIDVAGHVPCTLREALNHTGGLPDYAAAASYRAAVDARPDEPWDLAEIVDAALRAERSARGVFRYSNVGYWLAGALLEDVTGAPLPDLLSDLVFRPAGMTSTVYPAVGAGVTAQGYDTRWAGPAGAAWSTPADMVRFLEALFDGTLMSADSVAVMTTAVAVENAEGPWRRPGYGLGVMIDDGTGADDRTVGHGGAGPGYGSAAFIVPATGRAAAVSVRSPSDVDPVGVALRLLRSR